MLALGSGHDPGPDAHAARPDRPDTRALGDRAWTALRSQPPGGGPVARARSALQPHGESDDGRGDLRPPQAPAEARAAPRNRPPARRRLPGAHHARDDPARPPGPAPDADPRLVRLGLSADDPAGGSLLQGRGS